MLKQPLVCKKKPNTLYCFSPPVMIATMAIEVALAIITIFSKKSPLKNIAFITLILLAAFSASAIYGQPLIHHY